MFRAERKYRIEYIRRLKVESMMMLMVVVVMMVVVMI
jgi:hypothetical protein